MIRLVNPEMDAAKIAEIYNYYVENTTITFETEQVSVNEMRSRIMELSSKFPYYVYEIDGKIAGYCYVHLWKLRAAYCHTVETTIYLSNSFTGRGISKELMLKLIDTCRAEGLKHLSLASLLETNIVTLFTVN